MKHLDITFDLETAALCPTAAVISIGAVGWGRYAKNDPFEDAPHTFCQHIDLRSSFLDGFTFDAETSAWWSRQSADAKKELVQETHLVPIETAIRNFFEWINEVVNFHGAETVCLWSQGSDFDIAILRNICYKYGIDIPVKYTNFRDHRSVCMELASKLLTPTDTTDFDGENVVAQNPRNAYNLVKEYKGVAHNPVEDCRKSVYSTWQLMHLR